VQIYHPQPALDGTMPDLVRTYTVRTDDLSGYLTLTVVVAPRHTVEPVHRSSYQHLTRQETLDVIDATEALHCPPDVTSPL